MYVTFGAWLLSYKTTLFFVLFLGLHLQHMEIPRLGVESELQLLAYATAAPDLSGICDLCHSLGHNGNSRMFLRFTHVLTRISTSLFFEVEMRSTVWLTSCFC